MVIIITNPPFFEMHNPKHNQYKKMAMFAGSDVHDARNFGHSGIEFDTPVTDYPTFLEKVKKGDFKIIYPEFFNSENEAECWRQGKISE